jgi:hypothetical protein
MNESEAINSIVQAWTKHGLPSHRCAACLLQLFRVREVDAVLGQLPPELVTAVRNHVTALPSDSSYWTSITDGEWSIASGPIHVYSPSESRRIHHDNTMRLKAHFAALDQERTASPTSAKAEDDLNVTPRRDEAHVGNWAHPEFGS